MLLIITLLILIFSITDVLAEEYFPGKTWETRTAQELSLSHKQIDKLFKLTFTDKATMGAVLIKDGYIIKEQYVDGFNQNSYGTSWSTAKSFYAALIGISIDISVDSLLTRSLTW